MPKGSARPADGAQPGDIAALRSDLSAWIAAVGPAPPGSAAATQLRGGLLPEGVAEATYDLYGAAALLLHLGVTPGGPWRAAAQCHLGLNGADARAHLWFEPVTAGGAPSPPIAEARHPTTVFLRRRRSRWLVRDVWPTHVIKSRQGDRRLQATAELPLPPLSYTGAAP